jgi:hypothetical protein
VITGNDGREKKMTMKKKKTQGRLIIYVGASAWQSVPARVSLSNTPGWMDAESVQLVRRPGSTPVKEETRGSYTKKGEGKDANVGLKEGRKEGRIV